MHSPIPPSTPGFARAARPGELPADLISQAEAAVRERRAGGDDLAVPRLQADVAVGSLAPGVIALVTREGNHVVLAYSEQALNDELFVAVDRLLSEDLAERPKTVGTRTLTVMADYSVRTAEGGSEKVLPYRLHTSDGTKGNPITARILEGAKNEVPIRLAGMGTVRIVRKAPDAQ